MDPIESRLQHHHGLRLKLAALGMLAIAVIPAALMAGTLSSAV